MKYIDLQQSRDARDIEIIIKKFKAGTLRDGDPVSVKGAIHHIKDMGEFAFVNVRSPRRVFQCVWEAGKSSFDIHDIQPEDWVLLDGRIAADARSPLGFDIRMETITKVGGAVGSLPLEISNDRKIKNLQLDTMLNNRVVALRNPRIRAIMRVADGVMHGFRSFLREEGFMEFVPPKLVMGGAEGGQIASSVAVETFMKEMRALIRADMTAEQLRELASFCVAKANTAVYQRALQDPAYQGMGTTLVSAVAEEKYAIVCNIGDSRAYLIRGGEITRITHDHSVVQTLVENGNITAEEARTHPNRNLITRALGPDENTLCDAFEVSFTKGDKILLCTDGLVVTATDDEICRAVCAGKSAEESLDDLIALAKAQGAPDNVTAVLIEHE